jgi:hypothetical protein
MSKVVKQPVKFGGGSEPVVTGTKYQIPFDGQYVKYDDGSKVFKWFNEDQNICYSAQLYKGVWHCKVQVHLKGHRSVWPVEYIGRHESRKVAWKQVREQIDDYRKASNLLPKLKA